MHKDYIAMIEISRRSAVTSLVLGGLSLAALGCASDTGYRPVAAAPQPPPAGPPPGTAASGNLRRAFTASDRAMYAKCINETMSKAPVGRTWTWKNSQSGNGGTVTPTSPPQRVANQMCRTFSETITLKDGQNEKLDGRACQKADGSWEIAG